MFDSSKRNSFSRSKVILAVAACIATTGSFAANPEPVVVNVLFVTPITITEVAAMDFGLINQALNLEDITLSTGAGISGTGAALAIGGTPAAADVTVTATAGSGVDISIGSIVSGTGYALGSFTCKWDVLAELPCSTAVAGGDVGASQTLLIGATITGDNLATDGAANGSFEVTVAYQ